MIGDETAAAEARFAEIKEVSRAFQNLRYRTHRSWSRSRRVSAKAEHLEKGSNPRFINTSLAAAVIEGKTLYEEIYCARSEMENRIKECQFDLRRSHQHCDHVGQPVASVACLACLSAD